MSESISLQSYSAIPTIPRKAGSPPCLLAVGTRPEYRTKTRIEVSRKLETARLYSRSLVLPCYAGALPLTGTTIVSSWSPTTGSAHHAQESSLKPSWPLFVLSLASAPVVLCACNHAPQPLAICEKPCGVRPLRRWQGGHRRSQLWSIAM